MSVPCHDCGKFIPTPDMASGGNARFHFIPLNEFGPEESWWLCAACADPATPSKDPNNGE